MLSHNGTNSFTLLQFVFFMHKQQLLLVLCRSIYKFPMFFWPKRTSEILPSSFCGSGRETETDWKTTACLDIINQINSNMSSIKGRPLIHWVCQTGNKHGRTLFKIALHSVLPDSRRTAPGNMAAWNMTGFCSWQSHYLLLLTRCTNHQKHVH